jgi:hypothetical protein
MWRNFDTPYLDDADRPRPTSQLDLALAAAEPPASHRPRREARPDERPPPDRRHEPRRNRAGATREGRPGARPSGRLVAGLMYLERPRARL